MEETPLTLADMPEALSPGQPGWRRDAHDRGVWIPMGLNVTYMRPDGEHFMPKVQARRLWDEERRLGGRRTTAQVRGKLCHCSYCQINIGRGYVETEIYLRPQLASKTIQWKVTCGTCAVQDFGLPYDYCLVSHADWTGLHKRHIISSWEMTRVLKIQLLEATMLEKWKHLGRLALQRYQQHHHTRFSFPRERLWTEFVSFHRAGIVTFTDLYDDTTSHRQIRRVA